MSQNSLSSGALQRLEPGENTIVGTVLYPGPQLAQDGMYVSQVWISAQAGGSDPGYGLTLTIEDTLQNPIAGPIDVYGTGVPQLVRMLPLDRKPLRSSGPQYQVLIVRAHNKATDDNQFAYVGEAQLVLDKQV